MLRTPASRSTLHLICGLTHLTSALSFARPSSAAQDVDLAELKRQSVTSFCSPTAHLSLAKAHRDAGRDLLAFGIVDELKRYRSSASSFRAAFARTFLVDGDEDTSDLAIAELLEEHLVDMADVSVILRLGRVHAAKDDWRRALSFYKRAAKLEPDVRGHVDLVCEAMNRLGQNLATEEIMADFVARHPDGIAARLNRIGELAARDPVAARALVETSLSKYPEEGRFHLYLGQQLHAEQRLAQAQQSLVRAAGLMPESARTQATVANFFLNVVEDRSKALDYYLDCYFIDPNFHDGKYVDDRIRKLSLRLGAAKVEEVLSRCPVADCLVSLLDDENPAVVESALARAREADGDKVVDALVRLLSHEHPALRSEAMLILKERSGPRLDGVIRGLMGGEDLTALGLSCYLAVARWGESSFNDVRPLLSHDAELVRFYSLAALAFEGGPAGLALVEARLAVETHPVLLSLGNQLLSTARTRAEGRGR